MVGVELAGRKCFREQPALSEVDTLGLEICQLVFCLDTLCHGKQAKRFRHADDV